tara:strand:+ start:9602 stop:9877 length:276 start_codon:yes stop_codon:yes gene_type:complete
MVTVGILCAIGLGIAHVSDDKFTAPMIKYVLAAVAIMAWLFFVFIADLYMTMHETKKDLEAYQKQIHDDVMKRYIDVSNKCGVAVHSENTD